MSNDQAPATWRKSTFSNSQGACVEVGDLPGGARAVRDSKAPDAAMLRFTQAQWTAFTVSVRAGEFG